MFKMLFKLEYGWGTLSKQALQGYVAAKTITAEDYKEITGEDYVDPDSTTKVPDQTTVPAE